MGLFDGKLVVVTGGGTGIGQATALKFAAAGAEVVISGRRQAPLDETVGLIESAGGKAHALTMDMENGESVAAFAKSVLDTHGRIDVLVNNAGHSSKVRSIAKVSQEEWPIASAI